jgi:hypothetical protein
MRLTGNAIFLMAIMAVMVFVIALSLRMSDFRSQLLPIIFALVIIIASVLVLRKEFWRKKATAVTIDEQSDDDEDVGKGVRGYLVGGAWVVGFILASYLLGLIVSIALFTMAFMKTNGTRWLTAITSAILITVVVYFAFEFFLRVTLERGLIYTLLGY